MKKLRSLLLALSLLVSLHASAQHDTASMKELLHDHIVTLAAPAMQGRGYVNGGRQRAAKYIHKTFADLNLQSAPGLKSMRQRYSFPVNTFPGKMELTINGKKLTPGKDYLVDAASVSFSDKNIGVKKMDLAGIIDAAAWDKTKSTFDKDHIWLLTNTDSLCKNLGIKPRAFVAMLPAGCFIIPENKKQIWTVACHNISATVSYADSAALPVNISTASVKVKAKLQSNAQSENIIATVPGQLKDSLIVFSAHYDHLGKMGADAIFPGASDNASGTAMLLYLARYYAAHPQRYTMVFIAFSGEEAGLMGSQHFVGNAPFPLQNIRFLTNTDIMGDATDGVTVVNATVCPAEFDILNRLNTAHQYLPAIKSRGKAANSDHYHFSEKGVPAFFLYSNGGKGHYHDIFDTASEVSLSNIPGVAKLLIDFVTELQK